MSPENAIVPAAEQLGVLSVLRYGSFFLNGLLFVLWLKRRIVLKDFLAGRWEGVVRPSDDKGVAYRCILYVARHDGKDNSALLYYSKQDVQSGEITVKGLDTLLEYEDVTFVLGRKWSPRFMRVFHKEGVHMSDEPEMAGRSKGLPPVYLWDCKICSFLWSARMEVTIRVADDPLSFSGFLQKD
jgi:hypothetical protein